jgi:hypothetical protein
MEILHLPCFSLVYRAVSTQRTMFKYVGFEVFTAVVMKSIIFWDMTPCSPLSFNQRSGGTYRLYLQRRKNRFSNVGFEVFTAVVMKSSAEPIYLALKMEAIFSSETSVDTQRTTRRYIPEDNTLHNYRCENLRSCTICHLFSCSPKQLMLHGP